MSQTNDQEAADFPLATTEQLTTGTVRFTAVIPGTVNLDGTTTPAQGYSAELSQVASAAAPLAVDPVLAAIGEVDWITLSAPTALTLAAHNGKGIILLPGATISLAWADTGASFGCLVTNETGGSIQPQLDSAFTYPVPRNASGDTQIADLGTAAIYCQSWVSGTTANQVCRLIGETVA